MTEKPLNQTPPVGAGNADAPRQLVTLTAKGVYAHRIFPGALETALLEAIKSHMAAYGITEVQAQIELWRSVTPTSPTEHPDTPVSQEEL